MKRRWVLATATALILGVNSNAWGKIARVWNDLSAGPRVVGYNQEKDEIYHQESIVSVAQRRRPGGEHSYSGNRLEAFQFHGKLGRGGIYDALDDHKHKFDPRNYQYRRR